MQQLDFDRQAPVYYEEELSSTNTRLRELAQQGAAAGTVLLARRQTAGRGRQGRSFVSPEGGLYFSLLLHPQGQPEDCMALTALAALSVRRAVKEVTGMEAAIKWPNDLLYEGRKLCGILTELQADGAGGWILVLGIGLNLNTEAFPEELADCAVSVRQLTGEKLEETPMFRALLRELDEDLVRWQRDGCFFWEEYRRHSLCRGREVWVLAGGERKKARVLDINPDLSLQLHYEDGREEALFYGEVSLRV